MQLNGPLILVSPDPFLARQGCKHNVLGKAEWKTGWATLKQNILLLSRNSNLDLVLSDFFCHYFSILMAISVFINMKFIKHGRWEVVIKVYPHKHFFFFTQRLPFRIVCFISVLRIFKYLFP